MWLQDGLRTKGGCDSRDREEDGRWRQRCVSGGRKDMFVSLGLIAASRICEECVEKGKDKGIRGGGKNRDRLEKRGMKSERELEENRLVIS